MRLVNAYIDGFNFYYRAVKNTPWKWLDFSKLCELYLPADCKLQTINYFTANVSAMPFDLDAPSRQQIFLRALRTIPNLIITYGKFQTHTARMRLVNPPPSGPATVEVYSTREKGSDVNLATTLLVDSFRKACDVALVISSDSDLLLPVQTARRDFKMQVGLISPSKQIAREMRLAANFVKVVRQGALSASQFPISLTDATGPFTKPPSW
jgi:uncharacterized LabA/DUF88 family protein